VSHQVPGYNKNMNIGMARLTTLADLAGTDLGHFLERVAPPRSQLSSTLKITLSRK
jgi:hypothetical protein